MSANLGMRTVDVGAPQLAMHSAREVMAVADVGHYVDLMYAFYEKFSDYDRRTRSEEY